MTGRLKNIWPACSLLRIRCIKSQDLVIDDQYYAVISHNLVMVFRDGKPIGSLYVGDSKPRIFEDGTLEEFTKVVLDLEFNTRGKTI
ncbi:hypothetical protein [Pseudomonas aeruginosa]|uniref:hypothetical protein n=1 Tax=Pseudomonas aeruginosa TaxID=287 RepID=UPI001CA58878|nr:hypothetical protein [Pseudomonas aeruginosa]MBW6070363.1 hypothetical protein [Pseudomonas aeruginosa]